MLEHGAVLSVDEANQNEAAETPVAEQAVEGGAALTEHGAVLTGNGTVDSVTDARERPAAAPETEERSAEEMYGRPTQVGFHQQPAPPPPPERPAAPEPEREMTMGKLYPSLFVDDEVRIHGFGPRDVVQPGPDGNLKPEDAKRLAIMEAEAWRRRVQMLRWDFRDSPRYRPPPRGPRPRFPRGWGS